MKAAFLPPLIAIAAGLAWVGYQHHRLDELGREAGVMRQAIEAALRSDRAEAEAAPPKGSKATQVASKDNRIQWDKVLELLGSQTGDIGNIRLQVALKKQFAGMTADEIEAEFDRIAAMEISDSQRQQLEQMLAEELADKDPRWVVEHLFNRLRPDNWSLSRAFQKWVSQDLPSVIQWIDRQVAAGGFDSKSLDGGTSAWIQYESGVIPLLMRTDPGAAVARLKALPEDLRANAFSSMMSAMKLGEGKAYIDAIRATVPAGQYNAVLEEASRRVFRQGMDQMSDLIAATNPSQAEREIMVSAAFDERLVRSSDVVPQTAAIDGMRDWGAKQAPDVVDRLTGSALGEASGDFQSRAQFALQYAEKGDGDELLSAFLKSSDLANMETAVSMLDHISDETRREELRALLQSRSDRKGH